VRYTGLACRVVECVLVRRSIVVRDRLTWGFSRGFPLCPVVRSYAASAAPIRCTNSVIAGASIAGAPVPLVAVSWQQCFYIVVPRSQPLLSVQATITITVQITLLLLLFMCTYRLYIAIPGQ